LALPAREKGYILVCQYISILPVEKPTRLLKWHPLPNSHQIYIVII